MGCRVKAAWMRRAADVMTILTIWGIHRNRPTTAHTMLAIRMMACSMW